MGLTRLVRDATFDLFRRRGLTTMFANPGSTEVPFLTGLPEDIRFVLGLHEGIVVGMASGYAIGRNEPALVLLHTTAGLGTGVRSRRRSPTGAARGTTPRSSATRPTASAGSGGQSTSPAG